MNLPRPISMRYSDLIHDVESGKIKIPQFQREFVWDLKRTAKLLDSIIKGYPIGTFIFWRTTERLRTISTLGSIVTRIPNEDETIDYVLDGQQRITSLFVALKGVVVDDIDYSSIYINLDAKEDDEDIVITDVGDLEEGTYISFVKLLGHNIIDLLESFGNEKDKLKLIDRYQKNVENYDFSIIQVSDVPIDIATDIFTRINVGGKPLSVFEIMCAKIFDVENDFDLSEKYNEFMNELSNVEFDSISESIPLQLIALILTHNCKRNNILSMSKKEFIKIWDSAIKAIKAAVDYFISFYKIPDSQLLPFDALLIVFAYYFYRNQCKQPIGEHEKHLQDMFWRYSLAQRYNNSTDSKIAHDITIIDDILQGKPYKAAISIEISDKFLRENGGFRTNKSFIKAILCLFMHERPRKLDNNADVTLDSKYLLKGNSKNYHHFFPRAFLRKKGFEDEEIDNVINIIIVDDYLNKYKIKDRAPSDYITEFSKINKDILSTLRSHFIGDIEQYGIKTDNYEEFCDRRAKLIASKLNSFIYQDVEIDSGDIDDDESDFSDITAKEIYNEFWSLLLECAYTENIDLAFNSAPKKRYLAIPLMTSKAFLRYKVSALNQYICCELVFRDENVYQKLLLQRTDFESFISSNILWSDETVKTKKIIMEYDKQVDIYKRDRWSKYIKWLFDAGILIRDVLDLFMEDMDEAKGTAPDIVDNPVNVYCRMRIGNANGIYLGKSVGFKVFTNSIVRLSTKTYGSSQKKREELIKSGIIKQITPAKGEFIEDYVFNTPSQASDVIMGGSNNGWTVWKDGEGHTIDMLYRKK